AGVGQLSGNVNAASPAESFTTAKLRAGQFERVAENPEQRRVRLNVHGLFGAINTKCEVRHRERNILCRKLEKRKWLAIWSRVNIDAALALLQLLQFRGCKLAGFALSRIFPDLFVDLLRLSGLPRALVGLREHHLGLGLAHG